MDSYMSKNRNCFVVTQMWDKTIQLDCLKRFIYFLNKKFEIYFCISYSKFIFTKNTSSGPLSLVPLCHVMKALRK